jgi:hypothetical protein
MEQAENVRLDRRHIHYIQFRKLLNLEHVVGTVNVVMIFFSGCNNFTLTFIPLTTIFSFCVVSISKKIQRVLADFSAADLGPIG